MSLPIPLIGYLVHEHTLCHGSIDINIDSVNYQNTSFSVTIPANVGPSGSHYALIARTFQTDGSWYGSSLESDAFELVGANGTRAEYQKGGYTLWGDDGLACSGFACVKECAGDTSFGTPSNTTYQKCANACPSVTIDFESSSYGGQPTAALTTPLHAPSTSLQVQRTRPRQGKQPALKPSRAPQDRGALPLLQGLVQQNRDTRVERPCSQA
ncbi:hypothetical protein K458DRAFT_416508 [Lentithecium fluviatile CBS 122367]|uniref:Uncharacterized protein n=1 Tax=Lentithecium fluviatile CBS 122367 TaxID=1168545 RepID=A0A6G1J7K7_9PLEO|nr:hypothetical protein K458DRAFT_416508 [Lentithecium fluviatile CBS 122367]